MSKFVGRGGWMRVREGMFEIREEKQDDEPVPGRVSFILYPADAQP